MDFRKTTAITVALASAFLSAKGPVAPELDANKATGSANASRIAAAYPWSSIRRFPIETNFGKFKPVRVAKATLSNYWSSYVSPLYPNNIPVLDLSFNKDLSKGLIVSPIGGTKKLIYLDREGNVLQEFSTITTRVISASLTEKGDRIYLSSDRDIGESRIYLASFSNFAADPSYKLKIAVDTIAPSELPSVNASGSRLAYQSMRPNGTPRIWIADLDADGMPTNEVSITPETQHSYWPRMAAAGRHVVFQKSDSSGTTLIRADLENKVQIPFFSGVTLGCRVDLSGDGSKVVFEGPGPLQTTDVYLVDFQKSILYNLSARDSSVFGDPDTQWADDTEASISEDGTVIAYVTKDRWDYSGIKVVDFRSKKTFFFYDFKENKVRPRLAGNGDLVTWLVGNRPWVADLKKIREL